MSSVLGFCFRFFGPFFPFFWALELGCGVFGACSLGLVLWGCSFAFCFVVPSDSSSFSVIAAHILRVPRCLLAVVFSAHILTITAVSFLASSYHTSFPLHSPHFLDVLPFYHLCIIIFVSLIHSHLHLICFPVVIVISAQYHNTNFALLFSFHVPSSYQPKCG